MVATACPQHCHCQARKLFGESDTRSNRRFHAEGRRMFLLAKYRETVQAQGQNIRNAYSVPKAEQGRSSDPLNAQGIRQKNCPSPIISIDETENIANDEYNRKMFSGVSCRDGAFLPTKSVRSFSTDRYSPQLHRPRASSRPSR